MTNTNCIRAGCKDVWNAYMCEGASFSERDIPLCPTTASTLPKRVILWDEAKHIYKNALARNDRDFWTITSLTAPAGSGMTAHMR